MMKCDPGRQRVMLTKKLMDVTPNVFASKEISRVLPNVPLISEHFLRRIHSSSRNRFHQGHRTGYSAPDNMMPGERGVDDDEGDVNGDDDGDNDGDDDGDGSDDADDADDADDDDEEEDFRLIAHTFLCPMNPICGIWCDFGLKTYIN